jgi:FAD/FMN-containing dehydrogenase
VTRELRSWFGDLDWDAQVLVEARSVEDIVAAMRDTERYPSPVRGRGSGHSTTLCGIADGGTVVDVTRMNRIVSIGPDTVTTEAGALMIDVAKELERHGLQFYVNIELGSATLGSLACCATKDASMPGEHGQANSYCVAMKMITPSGEIREVDERDPELLQAARSSYGLFGIVYEVTFKVRPLQAMEVEHVVFEVDDFARKLPELRARGQSIMMYVFPYPGRVGVEFRRYNGPAEEAKKPASHTVWKVRNYVWKTFLPSSVVAAERYLPGRAPGYRVIDVVNRAAQLFLFPRLKARHTVPTDQIIRYPEKSGRTGFTFSIWAFKEEQFADTMLEYLEFAKGYSERVGFRPTMLDVGYRVEQDDSSLFSYTHDGHALTIDPVSAGGPGWRDFLEAFNDFCSERDGKPLFNQSWGLKPHHVRKAFGDRVDRFEEYRRRFDPNERLLNSYFRDLFQTTAAR